MVETEAMNDPRCCETCGQLKPEVRRAEAVARRVEMLRQECAQKCFRVVSGNLVSERVAAHLLGKSEGHLRNLRLGGRPIPCRRVMGRWMYALEDLAAVLENSDDE